MVIRSQSCKKASERHLRHRAEDNIAVRQRYDNPADKRNYRGIYGFEISDSMVSDITDRLLPQIDDWQKCPLDEVYPIVFIDAVHFSVRDNGQIRKLAAYVILAVSMTGHKEVLSIHIGENESAKYWLGV